MPQAMIERGWVILDELNLAEPQILERLNSVLEDHPYLLRTEHDNSAIGRGGAPVHPDFRIFATMNPAEYAGRSVLSPAYRDRWRGYRFVPSPGEAEYRALLRRLVFGVDPEVSVRGRAYRGGVGVPVCGSLAALPGIDRFLGALARFHCSLEEAARSGVGLGDHRRREKQVFSRRVLLSVLRYMGAVCANLPGLPWETGARRALNRYYLGRATCGDEREVVARLLDAAGIGPGVWELSQ